MQACEKQMTSLQVVERISDCPACRSRNHRTIGIKSNYALSQCSTCRTVFLNAQTIKDNVTELYDHYYERAQFELPAAAAASLEKLVKSSEPFRQTNRWLDVGYGEGGLLSIAERHGWSCYGTEISPQAIEHGRRRGWIVSTNAEQEPRFPQSGFDVVTMIELLEHVAAPHHFLEVAAKLLRPGGLLYITTPNAGSLNRRILGLEWSVFSPPEHMTIWTGRGLRRALMSAGLHVKRLRTDGLNPCEIIARVRRPNQSASAGDRNRAAFALNNAFSSGPLRRAVKAGINRCLSAFQAGDTLKVWAVRTGR